MFGGSSPMDDSQRYPAWRYHYAGKEVKVNSAAEDEALGGGWAEGPWDLKRYQGPRQASPEHDPKKWVDEWNVPGLSADQRKAIKAALWKAHSAFWDSPNTPNADVEAMKLAFDRIAQILFDAGLLNDHVLAKDLPPFVWDSAIAGGWWRFASEARTSMFRERLGRYWVWRDDSRNWDLLFVAKTALWQGEHPGKGPTPFGTAEPPKRQTRAQASRSIAGPPTPAPAGTRWEDIEISFLSDERVQIQIGSQRETRNYDEMGFADGRNGLPSKPWILLRTLASMQGLISV